MSESERHIKRAHQRSVERALREERLGLAIIGRVIVLDHPDPGRLLARLEAVCRSAQQNPGASIEVRQVLIDGTLLIRNAIARELGRPQTLLDPPGWAGHVKPSAVDQVAGHESSITQQLGLVEGDNSGPLADVINIQREQTETITAIHEYLVKALQEGPVTDRELFTRYILNPETPPHSLEAIVERRKELVLSGRVKDSGGRKGKSVIWTLVETKHIAEITETKKAWKRSGVQRERVECPECGNFYAKGAGIGTHLQKKHGYTVGQRRAVAASNEG